jgi:hydroxymethylbilane synthase
MVPVPDPSSMSAPAFSRPQLILGTRGSDLALAQERMVRACLLESGAVAGIVLGTEIIATTGDKRQDLRLGVPGADKAVFIKELEEALDAGTIDAAVHSLKDVPGQLEARFALVAALPRAPVEDVLVTRVPEHAADGLESLPVEALVATSSVRRACLLRSLRPDLRVREIRGNVPTRLAKTAGGRETGIDATILARAGLERLGFSVDGPVLELPGGGLVGVRKLDPEVFLPAAGQGAIVIETRSADAEAGELLARINHGPTWNCIRAERAWLGVLGAGCQTPVGVFTESLDGGRRLRMRTVVFPENVPPGPEGARRAVAEGPAEDPDSLARELHRQIRVPGLIG